MKIEQYCGDICDDQIRFDIWIQPRSIELSSRLDDNLDLRADIKTVLRESGKTICELIRNSTIRK